MPLQHGVRHVLRTNRRLDHGDVVLHVYDRAERREIGGVLATDDVDGVRVGADPVAAFQKGPYTTAVASVGGTEPVVEGAVVAPVLSVEEGVHHVHDPEEERREEERGAVLFGLG